MAKFLKTVLILFAALIGVGVFVAGFIAYFVTTMDRTTGQIVDGFGRPLNPTPGVLRLAFGLERMWTGFFWWLADLLWFFGGLYLAFTLFSTAQRLDKNEESGSPEG